MEAGGGHRDPTLRHRQFSRAIPLDPLRARTDVYVHNSSPWSQNITASYTCTARERQLGWGSEYAGCITEEVVEQEEVIGATSRDLPCFDHVRPHQLVSICTVHDDRLI